MYWHTYKITEGTRRDFSPHCGCCVVRLLIMQAAVPVPRTPGRIVWMATCSTRRRLLLPVGLLAILRAEAAIAVQRTACRQDD